MRNNIELGKLVIMPNHFHGITVFDKIPETHSNAPLRYIGDFHTKNFILFFVFCCVKIRLPLRFSLFGLVFSINFK